MTTIFLDFDGVMLPFNSYTNEILLNDVLYYTFPKYTVKNINKLIEDFDVNFVITSDWRLDLSLSDLNDLFIISGIENAKIIGKLPYRQITVQNQHIVRSELISEYLVKYKIEKYLVIDDLSIPNHDNNFVMCTSPYSKGISSSSTLREIYTKLKYLENN